MRYYTRRYRGKHTTAEHLPTHVLQNDLTKKRLVPGGSPEFEERIREQIRIELLGRALEGRL